MKYFFFLVVIEFLLLIILLNAVMRVSGKNQKEFLSSCVVWVAFLASVIAWQIGIKSTPSYVYVPAEVVAANDTSTYFGTEDGDIFWINTSDDFQDVPYLLGMDTHNTKDVRDDEIITVWKLCE